MWAWPNWCQLIDQSIDQSIQSLFSQTPCIANARLLPHSLYSWRVSCVAIVRAFLLFSSFWPHFFLIMLITLNFDLGSLLIFTCSMPPKKKPTKESLVYKVGATCKVLYTIRSIGPFCLSVVLHVGNDGVPHDWPDSLRHLFFLYPVKMGGSRQARKILHLLRHTSFIVKHTISHGPSWVSIHDIAMVGPIPCRGNPTSVTQMVEGLANIQRGLLGQYIRCHLWTGGRSLCLPGT